MIIAIPVDEKNLEASVGDSFARSDYFLIYNLEDDSHTFEDNTAKDSVGGAGLKAAQFLIDKGADGVITRRCVDILPSHYHERGFLYEIYKVAY